MERATVDRLYGLLVEEEDARVCKDIPEEACTEVPANFFKIGTSLTLTKLADELGNAKTVLPWLLGSIAAPTSLIGFLVPIRESGSLLPQLVIASVVRSHPTRKHVWILGAVLQALALLGMGAVAFTLRGLSAGLAILGLLGLFSLARGLNSVSSKDVIGKTVPKTRRGRLTGFTTAVSGVLTLALGSLLAATVKGDPSPFILALLLGLAALLWFAAAGVFSTIREAPGATEGGRDALREAVERLNILRRDQAFRRFVGVRSLLVSTALAGPFYVALARQHTDRGDLLAMFILASGLATALSSAIWGRYSDRSSRSVLIVAGALASTLGLIVAVLDWLGIISDLAWIAPVGFFLLSIAHSGVRIGRKTYLLDLGSGIRRMDYVAVSNTVIGVVLLLGGALGMLTPLVGPGGMLFILSMLGYAGALGGRALPET